MFYSLTILLIGVYLGQEFNLPNIKDLTLSVTNSYKEQPVNIQPVNIQVNYIERFFNFILNKQKA
jgi:hypothetical protein